MSFEKLYNEYDFDCVAFSTQIEYSLDMIRMRNDENFSVGRRNVSSEEGYP